MNQLKNPKLKIVFYRPHASVWFKNPITNFIKGQLLPNKYEAFFDHLLNTDLDVYFTSDMFQSSGFKGVVRSIFDALQLFFWCILNKISLSRVGFIFSKKSLAGKDVLFMMLYGNLTHESEMVASSTCHLADFLSDIDIYKIIHMFYVIKYILILNPKIILFLY